VPEGDGLWLRGWVATPDGGQMVRGDLRGSLTDDEAIGCSLARMLLKQGADVILQQLAAG
jgi:hydroxymethylbilane synthase